MDLSHQREP